MTMTVTQALLDSYRSGLDAYGQAAATYVEQFIAMVMAEDPTLTVADLREITIEAIQDALNIFGDQASELALALFENIMGDSYDLEIVDVIDPGMVDEKVRFFARDLIEGNTASFTRNVTDLTSYYVKRSAYENMVENCWRNDVRWARVPSGRETCSFCFMLSSRGFVYGSERKASQKKEGGAYHQNCDCIATPGFEGLDPDTQVEGYQPSEMYERLEACATTIGEKASATGDTARKHIRAEIDTRNWKWLYTGETPEITFETEELKREIEKNRPQEIETANRLRKFGIAPEFVVDSIEYVDEVTGLIQYKGLTDFANGYEIKTLERATSYNTINGYLKNTSRKANAKYVCFDNSSGTLDDGTLIAYILRSQSFSRGRVYIIDSNGNYLFIR